MSLSSTPLATNISRLLESLGDDDLYSIARTATNSRIVPQNKREAIEVILIHTPDLSRLFSYRKITSQVLFKYLIGQNVIVNAQYSKIGFVNAIQEYWEKGEVKIEVSKTISQQQAQDTTSCASFNLSEKGEVKIEVSKTISQQQAQDTTSCASFNLSEKGEVKIEVSKTISQQQAQDTTNLPNNNTGSWARADTRLRLKRHSEPSLNTAGIPADCNCSIKSPHEKERTLSLSLSGEGEGLASLNIQTQTQGARLNIQTQTQKARLDIQTQTQGARLNLSCQLGERGVTRMSFAAQSLNSTGQSLNSTGQSLNFTSPTQGNTVQSLNSTGQSLNSTGQSLNSTGQSLNIPGQSLNIPGQSLNILGQSLNSTGQSLNIPQSSIKTITSDIFTSDFCNWFYPMINRLQPVCAHIPGDTLRVEVFCSNSCAEIYIIGTEMSERKVNGDAACCDLLRSTFSGLELLFSPNVENGVQAFSSTHGLVKIMVCGTLHKGGFFVGIFEQEFGLVKSPIDNAWKIMYTKLNLKQQDVLNDTPPTLPKCKVFEITM